MWYIIGLIVDVGVVFVVLTEKNVWLGTAILVWTIFFLTLNWFLTNFKLKYDIKYNVVDSQTSGLYADTVTNNVNVKLFNGYKNELAKLKKLSEKVGKLLKLKWDLENTFEGIQGFMMIVLEIGMLYLAIKLWKKGLISAGDFILIESYILTICNQVWGFGRTIRYTYEALADAEEMTTILNTPHEIKDIANAKKLEITKGKIEFKNVYFYYHKKRKIFSNLSFNINAKEKIAFVGPSGSGKSTIIKLLLRMYDLPKGQILIDDQNISNVTQESLWENVSLVPQDPILFHRSLLDNIRYAKPRASEREIRDAARLAHCDEFINDFPEKYRTYVGERGVKLSGGERQRVAIARAILRNAPILILDEATSSLDSESESLIQDALSNLMKNKTVIVVAHRLSTIMKMDRIIVLRQGKIVEEGSHLELLKKPEGLYAKLWKFQAGGFIN
jgi:ATP-binding cassette subfamily B protein